MLALHKSASQGDYSAAIETPSGTPEDHWVKDGDKWIRKHVRRRQALCVPFMVPGGPVSAGVSLLPRRTTKIIYETDGDHETLEDEWDGDNANRILDRSWTGETTFYADEEKDRDGPPRGDDVCYCIGEGYGLSSASPWRDALPWGSQTLSYRIPVPKATTGEKLRWRELSDEAARLLGRVVYTTKPRRTPPAAERIPKLDELAARRGEPHEYEGLLEALGEGSSGVASAWHRGADESGP